MSNANSSWARFGLTVAVFVGIGFAVWCAERLIQASSPDLLWRDPTSGDDGLKFYRFDPVLGLFHKPSFTGAYRGVQYTMNSRGLRGPEIGYARTTGRSRVVLLGDSVTWGFGVGDGQTLADHLARAWHPTEVVNLAVAGFGSGQELMLLRHEGLRYEPDLVLLVFTIANDVEDTYFPDSADSYPANLFHLQAGELRVDRFQLSPLERLGLWLRHNSYIVSLAASQGAKLASGTDGPKAGGERSSIGRANRARLAEKQPDLERYRNLRYLTPPDASGGDAPRYARRGGLLRPDALNHYKVELVKEVLREIARTSREAGAEFAIALAPYAAELRSDASPNPLRTELGRFLERERIPVVDLLPLLRESTLGDSSGETLYVDSMHFSPAGNRVVAGLLASALKNSAD